jgi:hypothetical protein
MVAATVDEVSTFRKKDQPLSGKILLALTSGGAIDDLVGSRNYL